MIKKVNVWNLILMVVCIVGYAQSEVKQEYALQATDVSPILNGSAVPSVMVRTVDGREVNLNTYVKQAPTVLIFYRGGWCPYCNRQLSGLKEVEKDLEELGYRIVAISPDSPTELAKSVSKHDLSYTLLSDSDANAIKAFGIAFQMEKSLVNRYRNNYNIDIERSSGRFHNLLPAPAVFLSNKKGIIQFQYVHPDYKTRIEPSILLAAAQAYR